VRAWGVKTTVSYSDGKINRGGNSPDNAVEDHDRRNPRPAGGHGAALSAAMNSR
jgi:hypothetical protein